MTSGVPGKGLRKATRPATASPQRSTQLQPQSPQLSPPPPPEPDEDCRPNYDSYSLFPSADGDVEISIPRRNAEEEGQDRSCTPMATFDYPMKSIIGFAAEAVVAAAKDETTVKDAKQDRSATPKRIPARSMKSVGVVLAAAAGAEEETGRKRHIKCGLLNMPANAPRSRVSRTDDRGNADTSSLGGTSQRLATVRRESVGSGIPPVKCGQEVISAAMRLSKATSGSVEGDEASKAGATAIGTQGKSVRHAPIEEKDADVKKQNFAGAANIFWDHAQKGRTTAEFDAIPMTTQTAKLAEGR